MGDFPKALDDAARQVITIAGIVIGFYVNAVTKPEFQSGLHDWWLKLFFVAPIFVLLFSIISGLLVFFPGILDLNINSSTAAKLVHNRMVQRKWRRLLFASVGLVIGILVLAGALLAYFIG